MSPRISPAQFVPRLHGQEFQGRCSMQLLQLGALPVPRAGPSVRAPPLQPGPR